MACQVVLEEWGIYWRLAYWLLAAGALAAESMRQPVSAVRPIARRP